jgi:hypothetical protein
MANPVIRGILFSVDGCVAPDTIAAHAAFSQKQPIITVRAIQPGMAFILIVAPTVGVSLPVGGLNSRNTPVSCKYVCLKVTVIAVRIRCFTAHHSLRVISMMIPTDRDELFTVVLGQHVAAGAALPPVESGLRGLY